MKRIAFPPGYCYFIDIISLIRVFVCYRRVNKLQNEFSIPLNYLNHQQKYSQTNSMTCKHELSMIHHFFIFKSL